MHPEFIQLGPLTIAWYGVLVAAGFATGLWVAGRRAPREGLTPETVYDLGMWLILAGILGAKVFYVTLFWDDFSAGWRAEGWRALREGFVFYGGFIAAVLAVMVYARAKRLPLMKLADLLAPSLALGHAFGRVGCFFNGCCFGKACDLPWGVTFPPPHLAAGFPVHPTQLYEAAGNLLIFAGLSWWWRRKRFDGEIWWGYVLSYGVLRFANEFLRGDYPHRYFDLFSVSQLIALAMMLIGGGVLLVRLKFQAGPGRAA